MPSDGTVRPASSVFQNAERHPDRLALVSGDVRLTYAQLAERASALDLTAVAGQRIGVRGSAVTRMVGMVAADAVDARVHQLPDTLDEAVLQGLGLSLLIDDDGVHAQEPGPVSGPGVVVFTSGTTGVPKAALHTWDAVSARVRVRDDLDGVAWLLPYSVRAYAGLQVVLHALANAGAAIVSTGSPADAAGLAAEHGVRFLTGTPTFFRFLLATAPSDTLDALTVEQITLGGEAVDQALLDRLSARFPVARVGHIYASTELGACFSVHDGRAGFPAEWLDDASRPVQLTLRKGELWVRSPRAMSGYLAGADTAAEDGWFPTGDRIEVRDGRAVFLGRESERLNVGGAKVYPFEVEQVVAQVPGVRAVLVHGVPSSLVGQLVQADVVAEPGVDLKALRRSLLQHARAELESHMVPRRVVFVESLEHNDGQKVVRRSS